MTWLCWKRMWLRWEAATWVSWSLPIVSQMIRCWHSNFWNSQSPTFHLEPSWLGCHDHGLGLQRFKFSPYLRVGCPGVDLEKSPEIGHYNKIRYNMKVNWNSCRTSKVGSLPEAWELYALKWTCKKALKEWKLKIQLSWASISYWAALVMFDSCQSFHCCIWHYPRRENT